MDGKDFQEKENVILSEIPEEFRGAISYQAYEEGHAFGYEEVLIHVRNLVDTIKEPIRKYTERITKEKIN
jgi:hypothetical protein